MSNARELVMPEMPGMVEVLTTYLESALSAKFYHLGGVTASAAALDSATAAVEVLGAVPGNDSMLLAQSMLARITTGIFSSVQVDCDRAVANAAPIMDAECVAKYCGLIYSFIIFYPAAIANVSTTTSWKLGAGRRSLLFCILVLFYLFMQSLLFLRCSLSSAGRSDE